MDQYLIMCRSLTYAQRAERVLSQGGISSSVIKAPQNLLTGGCGYAVSLRHNFDKAYNILNNSGLIKGKVFKRVDEGEYEELKI